MHNLSNLEPANSYAAKHWAAPEADKNLVRIPSKTLERCSKVQSVDRLWIEGVATILCLSTTDRGDKHKPIFYGRFMSDYLKLIYFRPDSIFYQRDIKQT